MVKVTSRTCGFDVITTITGVTEHEVEEKARDIAENMMGYGACINFPIKKYLANEQGVHEFELTITSSRSCD